MIVQCENCKTKFNVDQTKIAPDGSWVRCSKCQNVFQVMPEKAPQAKVPETAPEGKIPLDVEAAPRSAGVDEETLMEDLGLLEEPEEEKAAEAGGLGKLFKVLFWILGILLVLALILVGGVVALDRLGLGHMLPDYARKLPGLSSLLAKPAPGAPPAQPAPSGQFRPTQPAPPAAQPAPGQPEAIRMALKDVRGYFRANQKDGRLFVIQGLVENLHPDVRTMVLVRGRLHDKTRKVLSQEMVYAGPVFSPEELRTLPWSEIKNRLSKAEGPDGSKYVVTPKGTIPFMIVFANLPSDVSEFTAEVVTSKPLPAAPASR